MINYDSVTIASLLTDSESKPLKLVIPNFQRDFVWDRDDQKKLFASFLIGIPIGSLLIIKGGNSEFSSKRLCFIDSILELDSIAQECNFLLDGQQRISTVKGIISNPFNGCNEETANQVYEQLYLKLRNRWLLKIIPIESDEDIWGFNTLYFDSKDLNKKEPSDVLPFLEYKRDLKNKERFYSPFYEINLRNQEQANWLNILATEFANNGFVPMWEFANNSQIFESVLDKIADSARQRLLNSYIASPDKESFINDLKLKNPQASGKDFYDPKRLETVLSDLRGEWKSSIKKYLTSELINQKISVIDLPKNEIARATIIFENMNRGGTPLSTFDLLVAKSFSPNTTSLRDTIREVLKENIQFEFASKSIDWNSEHIGAIEDRDENLPKETKDQFLNLLSLVINSAAGVDKLRLDHIKKHTILSLDSKAINSYKDPTIQTLKKTLLFFQIRLGVKHINEIGYKLMMLPISFILYEKGDEWKETKVWDKLEYWYWLSLFSGRYRDKQNERCIQDIEQLYNWIILSGDNNSFNLHSDRFKSVLNSEDYSNQKVLLLENPDYDPPSAIVNGILQYELSRTPQDLFLTDKVYSELHDDKKALVNRKLKAWEISKKEYEVEEHHIIPLATATNIGESSKEIRRNKKNILNSPLNLTIISKDANRIIRGYAPNVYLSNIINNINVLPLNDHNIPIGKDLFEKTNDDTGRKDFLKRRYERIYAAITNELRELFNS